MKADTKEMTRQTPLAEARSGLAAAQARQDEMAHRIAEEREKLTVLATERSRLVAATLAGAVVLPAEAARIDGEVRAIEGVTGVLQDALAGTGKLVLDAEALVVAEMRAEADLRFQVAVRGRIEAAEQLQRLANEFGAAFHVWLATSDDVMATWTMGRVPMSHEIEALRSPRLGAWTLPGDVQKYIVQAGSVNVIEDLPGRERANWGSVLS